MPYKELQHPKYIDFSRFSLEEWNEARDQVEQHNRACQQELTQKRNEALSAVAAVWGATSRQYKYLLRESVPSRPNIERQWRKIVDAYQKYLDAEAQRQKRREYAERRRRAVEALESNGYIAGEHFAPGRALTFAKQVLYELEPGVYAPRGLPPGDEEAG